MYISNKDGSTLFLPLGVPFGVDIDDSEGYYSVIIVVGGLPFSFGRYKTFIEAREKMDLFMDSYRSWYSYNPHNDGRTRYFEFP